MRQSHVERVSRPVFLCGADGGTGLETRSTFVASSHRREGEAISSDKCRSFLSRIRGPEKHPSLEQCYFDRWKCFFGRHQCAGVVTDDCTNEGAFPKVLRDHGRPMIATLREACPRIEDKPTVILLFRVRMTLVASFFENRKDLRSKKALRIVGRRRKFLSDPCGDEPIGAEGEENGLHRFSTSPRHERPARQILLL